MSAQEEKDQQVQEPQAQGEPAQPPAQPPVKPAVKPPQPSAPPRYDLRRESLERDSTWTAVRAGGPGGQHRNKSFTGVRLVHQPSGVIVTATERRSQAQNLEAAYERLEERLLARMHRQKPRKKTRVPKAVHRKRLDSKKRRGDLKKNRGKVQP